MFTRDKFKQLDDFNAELRPVLTKAGELLVNHTDAPWLSAVTCRRFTELLGNEIALRGGVPTLGENGNAQEQLGAFIWRLNSAGLLDGRRGLFDDIREAGRGVHIGVVISIDEARDAFAKSQQLALWFIESANKSRYWKRIWRALGDIRIDVPRIWKTVVSIAMTLLLVIGFLYVVTKPHLFDIDAPPSQMKIVEEQFQQPQDFVVKSTGHIRVRERPDIKSKVVAMLNSGDEIRGVGRQAGRGGTWIVIHDGGGYINESLLRLAKHPLTLQFATRSGGTLTLRRDAYDCRYWGGRSGQCRIGGNIDLSQRPYFVISADMNGETSVSGIVISVTDLHDDTLVNVVQSASDELRSKMAISSESLCALNVEVFAAKDSRYAGRDLGISGCPGSMPLPGAFVTK